MADHTEKNAGTTGKQSLDQRAIDEAIAAMQTGDPETEQAAGQGSADGTAAGGGDDMEAAAAASQAPVRSNGGETFGEVQSDGQEDLDAAIAAIQADVVEEEAAFDSPDDAPDPGGGGNSDAANATAPEGGSENVEVAAAGEASLEGVRQAETDLADAAIGADTAEAAGAAAAGEAGAQRAAQQDGDAATDATTSVPAADPDPELIEDHVRENPTAEPAQGSEADPGIDAIDSGEGQLGAGDHLPGAKPHPDAGEPVDDPDGVTDSESLQGAPTKTGGTPDEEPAASATEASGSAVDATFEGENTFSDLDESDLENAEPGRAATEEAQLAAMTAAFDDDSENGEPDEEKPEPATGVAAGRTGGAGTKRPEDKEGFSVRKHAGHDADAAKKPALDTSAGSSRKTGRPKKMRGLLLIAAVIAMGVIVLFGRDFYTAYRQSRQKPAPPPKAVEKAPNLAVSAMPAAESKPRDPYREKLREVGRLRADLLTKKKEIDQLKEFYRDGISELEEELQQEAARHRIDTFAEAAANHKILLDLRSIQRRRAYIDELEKPSNWLHQGSEELLYLSRRAEIDLQMSTIASGIELTRHSRHLNASLQKYQLSPERLAVDPSGSRRRPIEDIWNAIGEQNKATARHAVANGDQAIIAEICDGQTRRIAELKTLTIRASKCLSRVERSELFLNQLSSISPVAAKYLSNWNGQWLCLNGFRQLTPGVARHLFRWRGSWISLNGLEEFPPEIGEMLMSWQGRQLELMGLVHDPGKMERIGYQQLADWEKSGGKLFVPERIRSEIEKLNEVRGSRR